MDTHAWNISYITCLFRSIIIGADRSYIVSRPIKARLQRTYARISNTKQAYPNRVRHLN